MAPETNLDDVVAAVARRRRRYALYCLREEGFLELEALARQVAARQTDRHPGAVPQADVDRLVTEFRHNDLSVFERADSVEYDDRSDVVRYRDPPAVLEDLLAVLAAEEQPCEG